MPRQVIGKIPEFTQDESVSSPELIQEQEEVKQPSAEEDKAEEQEKETPSELPAEQTPSNEAPNQEKEEEQQPADDTKSIADEELEKKRRENQALVAERQKLLQEIQEARSQRRDIRQQQVNEVEKQISEDLDDIYTAEDREKLEKLMRAKGFIDKNEAHKMFYKTVEEDQKNKFFEQHPEYKPANDPNDVNWNALMREFAFYRTPDNPYKIGELLGKAHQAVTQQTKTFSGSDAQPTAQQKQQILRTAGVGGGGVQKGPSLEKNRLTPFQKEEYRRGGWSEEEIKELEKIPPQT